VIRETEQDKSNQSRILDAFAKKFNLQYLEFSSFSNKYRIDACFWKDGDIVAWAECKWYTNKAHLMLNVPKYLELYHLSTHTGLPSYLLFREGDRIGSIIINNPKRNTKASKKIILGGGTQKGRQKNSDDIEPLIKFTEEEIIWII